MPETFQHEHLATVPRGYKVRTVTRGDHEIRVAFPPGRRRRGTGVPVEILHPRGENPLCKIVNLINPSTLELKRAARERAKRIREARNPGKMTIERDPARGQFRATMRHPSGGSNLYAWGYTEKQAAAALRDLWREARRVNPSLLDEIRHGDKVTILVPAGIGREGQEWKPKTGRAVMRGPSGWVLNMGGAHGTPGVANERNIVSVRRSNPDKKEEPKRGESVPDYHARRVREILAKMPKPIRDVFDRNPSSYKFVFRNPEESSRYIRRSLHHQLEEAAREQGETIKMEHSPELGGRNLYRFRGKLYTPGELADLLGVRWPNPDGPAFPRGKMLTRAQKDFYLGRYDYWLNVEGATEEKSEIYALEDLKKKYPRLNPDDDELGQAEGLYEEFHGRAPREILEMQESSEQRGEYTALGDLVELTMIAPTGDHVQVKFQDDGVRVASSPNGEQLYLLGGNQDISGSLATLFGANDDKDLVDLGEAKQIVYEAAKWQTDFTPQEWKHDFGEESGVRPRAFFDQLKKRIFFAGGNYQVKRPGIVD